LLCQCLQKKAERVESCRTLSQLGSYCLVADLGAHFVECLSDEGNVPKNDGNAFHKLSEMGGAEIYSGPQAFRQYRLDAAVRKKYRIRPQAARWAC